MDDIKQYALLAESTNTKLEYDINAMLQKGWQLYGFTWIHDGIFFQSMITAESQKDNKKKK